MANPDKSIDPRLISAAREEFLEKGYEKASLTEICNKAGVTTGALYNRYKGKEELFYTLVKGIVGDMEQYVGAINAMEFQKLTDRELYDSFNLSVEAILEWFRFLYDRKSEFTLLVKCASGTRFSNFHRDWSDKMYEFDYLSYQEARRRGMTQKDVPRMEIHILASALWTLCYEPFIWDYTWEQVVQHAQYMHDFIDWHKVFGIQEPK